MLRNQEASAIKQESKKNERKLKKQQERDLKKLKEKTAAIRDV